MRLNSTSKSPGQKVMRPFLGLGEKWLPDQCYSTVHKLQNQVSFSVRIFIQCPVSFNAQYHSQGSDLYELERKQIQRCRDERRQTRVRVIPLLVHMADQCLCSLVETWVEICATQPALGFVPDHGQGMGLA